MIFIERFVEIVKQFSEWAATAVEFSTVALLCIALIYATFGFVVRVSRGEPGAYLRYRKNLGKMLILSLEFLVAADIIRTVAMDQTLGNVTILGILVLIRTFLSWSLEVEIEGRWPWKKKTEEMPEA